jgi:hypothetical protein
VTGGDDDSARALPRAPLPAPARREAAIAEALRRVDGRGEQSAQAGRPAAGPAPWRTRFNRPQVGALAGAFLVALIALPLAWTSLPDQARDSRPDRRIESGDPAAIANSPGDPGTPPSTADAAPDLAKPGRAELPPAGTADMPVPAPGGDTLADVVPAESGEAVVAGTRIRRPDTVSSVPVTEVGGDDIVVTGSRIRRPNLDSAVPITSVGGEEFFETGGGRRGDWNACTVDDPKRPSSPTGLRGPGKASSKKLWAPSTGRSRSPRDPPPPISTAAWPGAAWAISTGRWPISTGR